MARQRKIRILYVMRMIGFGGAERQLVELISGIDKNSFDIQVVLFYHDEGYLEDLQSAGVKVTILSTHRSYKKVAFLRLARFLKREHFDIVQLSLPIANFIGGMAARFFSSGVVVGSLRNANPFSFRDPFCLMDLVALNLFCHKVIVNSAAGKTCAINKYRIADQKILVIRNGKDFSRFTTVAQKRDLRAAFNIPTEHFVITTIGRICRQKGYRYLVKALAILAQKGIRNFSALLIGKPEETFDEVTALVHDEGLADHIKILGIRKDIPEILRMSDIFVLPSLWEGLANVVLEAMIARVPVIATNIDANAEIIEHGRTGVLVPTQDPHAIANGVIDILNNRQKTSEMVEAAFREVSEEYSLGRMVSEHEAFYREICQTRWEQSKKDAI